MYILSGVSYTNAVISASQDSFVTGHGERGMNAENKEFYSFKGNECCGFRR